jgi:hypothetical protein
VAAAADAHQVLDLSFPQKNSGATAMNPTMTVYAYGNVDALRGIFNAVAMVMASGDFADMIRVAVVLGFAVWRCWRPSRGTWARAGAGSCRSRC